MYSSTSVSIDHPDLTEKILEPTPLTDRQAIRLDQLGDRKKALRCEECGRFFRLYECAKNKHSYRANERRCGLFTCPECASIMARKYAHKYEEFSKLATRFLLVKIAHPPSFSPSDTSKAYTVVNKTFPNSKKIVYLASHSQLVTFALITGDHANAHARVFQALKKAYPTSYHALITKTIRSEKVYDALLEAFTPDLPKTPEVRAELEISFGSMRRLRVRGFKNADLSVYKNENVLTDNSHDPDATVEDHRYHCDDCGGPAVRKAPRCPQCGSPPARMSQWMVKGIPISAKNPVRWVELYQLSATPIPHHH